MAHYIDKDALVAEIERLMTPECGYSMNKLLDFIDTIEVKEVDLEKELDRIWFDNKFGNMFDNSAVDFANVREICKHFFELGMRVNNLITAADRGVAEEIIINLKRVEKDYRINLTKEIEWVKNQVKKGE